MAGGHPPAASRVSCTRLPSPRCLLARRGEASGARAPSDLIPGPSAPRIAGRRLGCRASRAYAAPSRRTVGKRTRPRGLDLHAVPCRSRLFRCGAPRLRVPSRLVLAFRIHLAVIRLPSPRTTPPPSTSPAAPARRPRRHGRERRSRDAVWRWDGRAAAHRRGTPHGQHAVTHAPAGHGALPSGTSSVESRHFLTSRSARSRPCGYSSGESFAISAKRFLTASRCCSRYVT